MQRILVGVSYAHPKAQHLHNCLTSLTQQTVPARILVCQDRTVDGPLVAWPGVETREIVYDRSLGGNLPKVRNVLLDEAADIYVWIDGDCIVDRHFLACIADCLQNPYGLVVFPRVRVFPPADLSYGDCGELLDLQMAPHPPRGIDKSRAFIGECLARWDQRAKMEVVCGPCQACCGAYAESWDESFTNWGCDEQDWGYRMIQKGAVPVIGPTVYHQEHEMPADWMSSELHARNIEQLWGKHGR